MDAAPEPGVLAVCQSCLTAQVFATASLMAGVGVGLIVLAAPARGDHGPFARTLTAIAAGVLVFVTELVAGTSATGFASTILAEQPWPQFAHVQAAERLVGLGIVAAMTVPPVVVCWMARARRSRGTGPSRVTRVMILLLAAAVGLGAGLFAVDRRTLDFSLVDTDLVTLDWSPTPGDGVAEWVILYQTPSGELGAVDDRGRTLNASSQAGIEPLYFRVGEPERAWFVHAEMAQIEPFAWQTHHDDRLSPVPGHGGFSVYEEKERVGMAAFSSGLLWGAWRPSGRFEPRDRWSLGDDAVCMQYGDEMIVIFGLDPVEVRAVVRGSGPIPVPIDRFRGALEGGLSSGDMPQATTTTTTPPH